MGIYSEEAAKYIQAKNQIHTESAIENENFDNLIGIELENSYHEFTLDSLKRDLAMFESMIELDFNEAYLAEKTTTENINHSYTNLDSEDLRMKRLANDKQIKQDRKDEKEQNRREFRDKVNTNLDTAKQNIKNYGSTLKAIAERIKQVFFEAIKFIQMAFAKMKNKFSDARAKKAGETIGFAGQAERLKKLIESGKASNINGEYQLINPGDCRKVLDPIARQINAIGDPFDNKNMDFNSEIEKYKNIEKEIDNALYSINRAKKTTISGNNGIATIANRLQEISNGSNNSFADAMSTTIDNFNRYAREADIRLKNAKSGQNVEGAPEGADDSTYQKYYNIASRLANLAKKMSKAYESAYDKYVYSYSGAANAILSAVKSADRKNEKNANKKTDENSSNNRTNDFNEVDFNEVDPSTINDPELRRRLGESAEEYDIALDFIYNDLSESAFDITYGLI